jgi:two-component system, cell cycle sensor histidine kinase and response regulator CckA
MPRQPTYEQLSKEVNDLNERMEIYRALVHNSPDLLYRTDLQGNVTYVSPSLLKLSGHTKEDAIGNNMADTVYVHPEEREIFLKKLQETGHVTNFQAQLKRKDGSLWWASTNAHFLKDAAGNVIGVEGITRDITELKTAEAALRKSEERFRLVFHTSPDSISLTRAVDGIYIDINESFTKNMGYTREDIIGKSSVALNIWKNPEDRRYLIDELAKKGYVENLETEFVAKDGITIIGLMSARIMKIDEEDIILTITRDITEHKKLEQQLNQANKLQALGTLAGGIAHNFNNLLMGIAGHASLIEGDLVAGHELSERVKGIEQCVQSAADLTKQLLGLARGGKYEIKAIDLNALLVNSADMFGRTRKEIQIHTKVHHGQVVINADRNQIEQVLLNLFVNAWQAMPNGGDLYLETAMITLDDVFCQSHQVDPGRYCKVSVTDTGIGMDEETRQCAFDPFFTTKETECGTGLGLASVYGIIKNHGGMVDVLSELNCGTTVNIYLPASSEEVITKVVSEEELIKGSETILLVDDEAMLINVAQAMLERLGYHVLVSSDGLGAIEIVTQKGNAIDLVILDLIMPGMDGGKTFDCIRDLQPNMPVLLSSGYSLDGQASDIINRGCNGFIQKPFNLYKLSKKIRQILDGQQWGEHSG